MRIHRDERGQTIILVALSLPLLLGFIGLATDVGALFKLKRTLQTAADAAAIAGALNHNAANPGAWHDSAIAAATANGFTAGNGVTITPADGPTWPSSNYVGQTGYVEVTITKVESTIFLALFGHPSVTVLARAVAAKTGPPAACIYAIGDGVNPPGPGLTVTGQVQSQSPGCGVVVDSSASPPMQVTGMLTMKSIGTVGNCTGCGGSPQPVSGIIPYSDPLAFLPLVNIGGCAAGLNLTGTQNIFPGCYNGLSATGSYVITLQPGTYTFNGALSLSGSGSFSGSGVTIVMANSPIAVSVNTVLNLSAPILPPDTPEPNYNGILFAQGSGDITPQTLNLNTGSTLQGILYFPDAPLTVNNNTAATLYTDFVAQSLTFTGTVPFTFNDYASAPGVISSPLSSAVLVE